MNTHFAHPTAAPLKAQGLESQLKQAVAAALGVGDVADTVSPYAMICRHRVEEAMLLMLGTNWPLVDIAHACGFVDQSHFTRTFHRHLNTSPGRWRRSHTPADLALS